MWFAIIRRVTHDDQPRLANSAAKLPIVIARPSMDVNGCNRRPGGQGSRYVFRTFVAYARSMKLCL